MSSIKVEILAVGIIWQGTRVYRLVESTYNFCFLFAQSGNKNFEKLFKMNIKAREHILGFLIKNICIKRTK